MELTLEARLRLLRSITATYALGLLVMGLIPIGPLPLPTTFVPQDKLIHALVFAGLTVLVTTA
ncbi:MAG: hypothetical protein KC766_39590, partial [Myxococcales bacterium]|nr:hypothetical protein [Myxococcales bacterium]